jgi:multidrug efflux pump subunit AcrA (membrane-fusion protein)
MTMTLTRPRLIAITLTGVIVAAAIVLVGVYAFRDRLRPTPEAGEPSPPELTAKGSAAVVPRTEVSIDPQRQQLMGVRVAPVERGSVTASVRTTGVVRYDETRLVDVNLKLDGWIRELHVDYTGQLIQKGQPLFTLYSPDLLATQQEYLLALKTRDQVAGSPIADAREYADRVVEPLGSA